MLQHVFATMNELLDKVIQQYAHVEGEQKKKLEHQLSLLCSMSDHIMEEWLCFDERLSLIKPRNNKGKIKRGPQPCTIKAAKQSVPDNGDPYQRGQGYYCLMMYKDATKHLEQAIQVQPKNIGVRTYLAMSYLHLGNCREAGRHFQFIIPLTNSNSMKAIAYNALGCIYVKQNQFGKAQAYFQKAHKLDPTFPGPIMNLKVCQSKSGQLAFGGGHMMPLENDSIQTLS